VIDFQIAGGERNGKGGQQESVSHGAIVKRRGVEWVHGECDGFDD